MLADSSFTRLADAWKLSSTSQPFALAQRGLAVLARSAGLRQGIDPYALVWVSDREATACPRAVTSLANRRQNFHVEVLVAVGVAELEALLHHRHPRLLVVDVDWCARVGISAVRHLHRLAPGTDWVLCWDAPSPRWLDTLLQSGARGAVLRTADDEALARAFDAVLAREIWLPRQVMQWLYASVIDVPRQEPDSSVPASAWGAGSELTVREAEVHELMRHGLTNHEIGERLSISINTVKKHLANAFEKRGIRSRRQTLA